MEGNIACGELPVSRPPGLVGGFDGCPSWGSGTGIWAGRAEIFVIFLIFWKECMPHASL